MKRKTKLILGSVGAFAFALTAVGGTMVSAKSSSTSSFIDRVAELAGVDKQKLAESMKQASVEQIDQKVKDGEITQAQADKMKKNVENGKPHGFGGGKFGKAQSVNLDDIATYLGIDANDLKTGLGEGKTLTAIAAEQGKSEADLKQFLSQKFEENLMLLVKDGRITQEKADILSKNKDQVISDILSGKRPERRGDIRMMEREVR